MPTHRELSELVSAMSAHPHDLLGPHLEAGGLVVRHLRPDARDVTVVFDRPELGRRAMEPVLDGGLFEVLVAGARELATYALEVVLRDGRRELYRDPYAFAPTVGALDLHLFAEGTHAALYRVLGAHVRTLRAQGGGPEVTGTAFAVWAPSALRVSVVGPFTEWKGARLPMRKLDAGVFELFVPGLEAGSLYKYELVTRRHELIVKSDPFAFALERRPHTASIVTRSQHVWTDAAYLAQRDARPGIARPISIYEVHLGSWRRKPAPLGPDGRPTSEDGSRDGRFMTYRELADELVDYVAELGFTHLELLPVLEHPYDGSWGYQVSGYFAPTSRYGSPDDFRAFVDRCHARGLGVILDFVPAHFPKDAPFLARFDGTALYEHPDPRRGEHRQWGTHVFHYGRPEVRGFLLASALYWLDELHVDGLRVDAVASMLYLDYGASHPHEWLPNEHGGRENLDAVRFLRELNERVHAAHPGALVCAEESTSWPGITTPTYVGGLGFDLKWNMGWMHDTLRYFRIDPLFRSFHHNLLTFGLVYAFTERFLLPLSHDEVVHLKKSLLSKMPGELDVMRAGLRALFAYMWTQPGKKLLFMGGELGAPHEWSERASLPWGLLDDPGQAGIQRLVGDLNRLYRDEPALYEREHLPEGFRWIDANDTQQSVVSYLRYGATPEPPAPPGPPAPTEATEATEATSPSEVLATEPPTAPGVPRRHVVFVGNFTPVARRGYRVGVPRRSAYLEVLNTDSERYGGAGQGNLGRVEVEDVPCHGFACSLTLYLPPLSGLVLRPERDDLADEAPPRASRPPPPDGHAAGSGEAPGVDAPASPE
jgi:1,4-alpha-glucan branching enzyme